MITKFKITLAALVLATFASNAQAARIRDVARVSTDQPKALAGMGLIVGLKGTGDGSDFKRAMTPLMELMRRFDNPVGSEAELKNANNVAIVDLAVDIPPQGAHAGDSFDIKVSSVGAAKSLKGGRLVIIPMILPVPGDKVVCAMASGEIFVNNETPTNGVIKGGAKLIRDLLPTPVNGNRFTLVLYSKNATREIATAVADQINEDVSPQTDGKHVAVAVDATSVDVIIPPAERHNPTPFISRIMTLPLPIMPEPAKVFINTKTKTIVFTEEVELAPTTISQGDLTITVSAPNQPANPPGSQVNFITLDPAKQASPKLRDLENAFNLLHVSADDRIAIVKLLAEKNILKAELVIE